MADVAGCVIKQDDKYLMIQEKLPKAYGLWNMPAGHIDEGESPEQAAVREVKEETGFDVSIDQFVGLYTENDRKRHAFLAHILGGELTPDQSEILDAQWLTYEEVQKLNQEGKIRAPWVFEAISSIASSR